MTEQEVTDNRNAAVALIKSQLGLTDIPGPDWTLDQRNTYMAALSAYIVNNPGLFVANEVNLAQSVQSAGPIALENTGLLADAGVFANAFIDQAKVSVGDPLKAIGDGVTKAVTWIGNLLPFAVLAVAFYYFLKAKKNLDTSRTDR